MYKQKILGIHPSINLYQVTNSYFGSAKPKKHPQQVISIDYCNHNDYIRNLKPGDLVRCDGKLFASRPRPILTARAFTFKEGKWVPDYLYKPVKVDVDKGLWVLRAVG